MLPDEERLLPSPSCKNVIKIKVVLANGCLFRVDDFRVYVVSIESGHLRTLKVFSNFDFVMHVVYMSLTIKNWTGKFMSTDLHPSF